MWHIDTPMATRLMVSVGSGLPSAPKGSFVSYFLLCGAIPAEHSGEDYSQHTDKIHGALECAGPNAFSAHVVELLGLVRATCK